MATQPPVGRAIKRARERLRMTQKQLGETIGVSQKTIDSWEHDRHYPKSSIGALEEVLGVSLDGADEPSVVIPPELERRLARLSEEERAYVVELLTRPRGAAPDRDAKEARA